MKKYFLTLISLFVVLLSVSAKSGVETPNTSTTKNITATKSKGSDGGYNIQVKMTDMKDTDIFLAFYYNGKTYAKDTTHLDKTGVGVFHKDKKLDEGVYIVYFKQDKFFDLLIGKDQNIKLKADTTNLNPTITAGDESVKFGKLVQYMTDQNKARKELYDKYVDKKIDSLSYVKKVEALGKEVEQFQQEQVNTNKDNFFGAFVKGTIPVEVPEFKELPDTARPLARYLYEKEHYFDNINLSDPRFLRTPYFVSKVDYYMQHKVIPNPDSLFHAADALMQKSKGDTLTYQAMVTRLMNFGLTSKQMGMDKMWYQIAEKYYISGEAKWADTTWIKELKDEMKKVQYNMIGMKAKNLRMLTTDSVEFELRDVYKQPDTKFVMVYFFEPSCGHCKKITPVMHDTVYAKYHDKGFKVFCCYTQTDKKEWIDFLEKHKLYGENWFNLWDPKRDSFFWYFYDATTTPGIYLLNDKGEIIAKKISSETLDEILNYELIEKPKKQKEGKK